jgi:hypothetical protein
MGLHSRTGLGYAPCLQSSFDLLSPNIRSVLHACHGDAQRLCPIPRCASLTLLAVLLNLIPYSVPVCTIDYSSYTFEDTGVTPKATFHLADHSYSASHFFHILYGVRPFRVF